MTIESTYSNFIIIDLKKAIHWVAFFYDEMLSIFLV
jgi:hypothetical protein